MWDASKAMVLLGHKWLAFSVLVIGLFGCGSESLSSPQAIYDATRLKFQRGELIEAQQEADHAYLSYLQQSPEWAWRFRVLQAEILVWRGMSTNALSLLDAKLPSTLSRDKAAVRQQIVQGSAYSFLQQYPEAERHFAEAQQLARANQPSLFGEIALARGTMFLRRSDYAQAESSFRDALQIARHESQPFLEVSAQGSLGVLFMYTQRYGESIQSSKAALKPARSLGARSSIAKILGNLGWAYYKMGDWDSALELFTQAEALSAQLGLRKDQLSRLINIGNVHYERRKFDAAQGYYEQALAISKQLDDKQDWSVCISNLAETAIEKKQFNDAERYNQEAFELQRGNLDRISKLYFPYNEAQIAAGRGELAQAKILLRQVINGSSGDFSLHWMAQAKLANVYAASKQPQLAHQEFRSALATFDQARPLLTVEEYKLTFLTSALHFYNDYLEFLIQRGRIAEALHVVELNRARTLAEGLELKQTGQSWISAE